MTTRSATSWSLPSFNGATTFQPWIVKLDIDQIRDRFGFQWGHDFSAMDRFGQSLVHLPSDPRFNGATTFQPWIGYDAVVYTNIRRVSMGPRLFSHG